MGSDPDKIAASSDWPEIVRKVRAQTPARLLEGRSGAAYRTGTQMELRAAHAAARDAVRAELDLQTDFGSALIEQWKLFEVGTKAVNKEDYLLRPDLGRKLCETSRAQLSASSSKNNDLQLVIGDGLSLTAVKTQVPALLPFLYKGARDREWTLGETFVVRHCRVGVLNEIGDLLAPKVAVLLIGERPGLATAESLSAYMAYRPRAGHTDADRNLISNIHARGTKPRDAASRILSFAALMMNAHTSGCLLREGSPALEG
jgi:ethanolamine ammonia-lyase small subunit